MVALKLQQFQYDPNKIFLQPLVFPVLFGPSDSSSPSPGEGGVARGGGGDFKGGMGGTRESVRTPLFRSVHRGKCAPPPLSGRYAREFAWQNGTAHQCPGVPPGLKGTGGRGLVASSALVDHRCCTRAPRGVAHGSSDCKPRWYNSHAALVQPLFQHS